MMDSNITYCQECRHHGYNYDYCMKKELVTKRSSYACPDGESFDEYIRRVKDESI